MTNLFKKAERKKSYLKMGISGPSGSGKTFSALRLAKGLGSKIAVIDTEKGSASLYSDKFEFDVLELEAPYTPERYMEAMKAAVSAGYEVLIVDSVSHLWAGVGGVLDEKSKVDARGGNSFNNWGKFTPRYEAFMETIKTLPIHIITTVRSKQEYSQVSSDGKTKIQKLGNAPIIREGFEYELTMFFDVDMSNKAETSKDRSGLFTGQIFQITEETGKTIKNWLETGKDERPDLINELKELINFSNLSEEDQVKKEAQINNLTNERIKHNIDLKKKEKNNPSPAH